MKTQTILTHYLACALWSSNDDHGTPLDENYSVDDIAPASVEASRTEIEAFLAECKAERIDLSGLSAEQFGHDLWLTRNRHGAGFWDRGLGALGERLTEKADSLGDRCIYVGDGGLVYIE
jgi:hypothetical protein